MKWIEALRIFNEGSSKWCIPRKDSSDYLIVKEIMKTGKKPEATKPKEPEPITPKEPEPKKPNVQVLPKQPPLDAIEPIHKSKAFTDDFKAYIKEIAESEGDPLRFDYSAIGFLTDYIMIYLMEKYKDDCAVFVRINEGSKTNDTFMSGFAYQMIKYANIYKYQIARRIAECIENGGKLVAIPFKLKGHANMMIYRVKNNSIEHYEPHGASVQVSEAYSKESKKVIDTFKEWIQDWADVGFIPPNPKFIASNEICPTMKGLQYYESYAQQKEKNKYNVGEGFCQMWSLFYLEMCLKYPEVSGDKLNYLATHELTKMGIEKFIAHIVKYTANFNKVMRKYFNKDVDITSTALKKDSKLQDEIKDIYNKKVEEYLSRNKPAKANIDNKLEKIIYAKLKQLIIQRDTLENEITKVKGEDKKEKKKLLNRIIDVTLPEIRSVYYQLTGKYGPTS